MITYPKNRMKVTDANITFKWEEVANVKSYQFTLLQATPPPYEGSQGEVPESQIRLTWKSVERRTINGTSVTIKLEPDHYYKCAVSPVLSVKGTIKPLAEECIFFVKKSENYLEKYLNFRFANINSPKEPNKRHINPIVPLFFFQLDRYIMLHENLDFWQTDRDLHEDIHFMQTDLDKIFSRTMCSLKSRVNDPKQLIRIEDRLKRARGNYLNIRPALKNKLFVDLPRDYSDVNWADKTKNNLANVLSQGNPFWQNLKKAPQKTLYFAKVPVFPPKDINLGIGLKIPLVPTAVANYNFNESETYKLEIKTISNQSKEVDLLFQKDGTNCYLSNSTIDMRGYSSAEYKANLYRINASNQKTAICSDFSAEIRGGVPVILEIIPNSVKAYDLVSIEVKVSDGGVPQPYIELDINGAIVRGDYHSLKEQTFQSQTFQFQICLTGRPPGQYQLSYYRNDGKRSANTLILQILDFQYSISVESIRCIDESNPEWWGDDSISFQIFANTAYFVSTNKGSLVYDGFSDNTTIATKDNDTKPFYVDDPANNYRIIEDFLNINASIFEHDDLGWVGWLINEAIDIMQNFIIGVISTALAAVTGGSGEVIGFFIAAGIEASGMNDMRRELVNSLVSGWEIEVLHDQSFKINKSYIELLNFASNRAHDPIVFDDNESQYQLNLFYQRQ